MEIKNESDYFVTGVLAAEDTFHFTVFFKRHELDDQGLFLLFFCLIVRNMPFKKKISSIAIFFVTTLIGVCCKKKKKTDVTKPTTTTVSKDSKATVSQKVAKDYPRAPPIKNPPLAPPREDDDTLRNVQSLKKDDHS